VAHTYGVSEKTIRDIWKGRTWQEETWHLDTTRPMPVQSRTQGRPKGSKDRAPRKSKSNEASGVASSTSGYNNRSPCIVQGEGVSQRPITNHDQVSPSSLSAPESKLEETYCCKGHVGGNDGVCFFPFQHTTLPADRSAFSKSVGKSVRQQVPRNVVDELLSQWPQFLSTSPGCRDPFEGDWPYLRT
jgi:hypothetical protein